MAIAQSVVKAHKGFICATDSQGGGLTLTVVLPVAPLEPKIAVGEPLRTPRRNARPNATKPSRRNSRRGSTRASDSRPVRCRVPCVHALR